MGGRGDGSQLRPETGPYIRYPRSARPEAGFQPGFPVNGRVQPPRVFPRRRLAGPVEQGDERLVVAAHVESVSRLVGCQTMPFAARRIPADVLPGRAARRRRRRAWPAGARTAAAISCARVGVDHARCQRPAGRCRTGSATSAHQRGGVTAPRSARAASMSDPPRPAALERSVGRIVTIGNSSSSAISRSRASVSVVVLPGQTCRFRSSTARTARRGRGWPRSPRRCPIHRARSRARTAPRPPPRQPGG